MYVELGTNLFHTAVLFIIVWGIVRFFGVLGEVAKGQSSRRMPGENDQIKYTK